MSRRRFSVLAAAALLGMGLGLAPALLAQENQAEKKEEKKGAMPEPSIGWEWANFVVLAGLLGYMAKKMGGPFFNTRAGEIRKGIDEAEKIKAESNAKIAAINSKLGRLDAEIASLRESAAAERRAAEQRIKAETQQELERIRTHSEAEIEIAGKAERIALQQYAAQLAMSLAETKVRARRSASTEDALIQAFINGLGAPKRPQTHN
jgi:F-type H+-transporting ATPase subunit b